MGFFVAATLLLVACNPEPQITPNSRVVFHPANKIINIVEQRDEFDQCVFSEDFYQDIPVNVSLLNEQGFPIARARLGVYLEYARNSFSARPSTQLFYDWNGNGVADVLDELISDVNDPIFNVRTSAAHGDAMFIIRANLSCSYRAGFTVFAGPTGGVMDIDVRATGRATRRATRRADVSGSGTVFGVGQIEGPVSGVDNSR